MYIKIQRIQLFGLGASLTNVKPVFPLSAFFLVTLFFIFVFIS